ncbi:hypothetical protein ACW5F0_14475 [Luteimonas sp. A534]
MHLRAALLLMVLTSCSNVEPPSVSPLSVGDAEHSLRAFNGKLLGADRGEFTGYLAYQDQSGKVTALLRENVHGIVENREGIFVLTGLAHLGTNDGYLYKVSAGSNGQIQASQLGYLPGAPSHVQHNADGSITFLIYMGYRGNERHYQCHSLVGSVVSYSNNCDPPIGLRSNNSFKPTPLRGAA